MSKRTFSISLAVFVLCVSALHAKTNDVENAPYFLHHLVIDQGVDSLQKGKFYNCRLEGKGPSATVIPMGVADTDYMCGDFYSRSIESPFPFNEICPSWNIQRPEGAGYAIYLRVGKGKHWSEWLCVAKRGPGLKARNTIRKCQDGEIDTDYFISGSLWERAQYRIQFFANPQMEMPSLKRFAFCFSNTEGDKTLFEKYYQAPSAVASEKWQRRLPVPHISQKTHDEEIAHQNCSPTSLTMVMEYYGAKQNKEEVAHRCFDKSNKIYGNWPENVQTAFEYGFPGVVQRFNNWNEVKPLIAAGRPIIISIRCDDGVLQNAPYDATIGHLIVVCGFDKNGDILVCDPAARTAKTGMNTYKAEELYNCWMTRAGTAYVLEPVPSAPTKASGKTHRKQDSGKETHE